MFNQYDDNVPAQWNRLANRARDYFVSAVRRTMVLRYYRCLIIVLRTFSDTYDLKTPNIQETNSYGLSRNSSKKGETEQTVVETEWECGPMGHRVWVVWHCGDLVSGGEKIKKRIRNDEIFVIIHGVTTNGAIEGKHCCQRLRKWTLTEWDAAPLVHNI